MLRTMPCSPTYPNVICRTCLKSGQEFCFISSIPGAPAENLLKSLRLLVPELRLRVSAKPAICMPCYNSLREAHSFRLRCLHSEKMINIYMKETHTPFGDIKLHDVVNYCKGIMNSESENHQFELTNDAFEWFGSNDANAVEAEPENVEVSGKKSTDEDTNESNLAAQEVQPESVGSKANPSILNTSEKNNPDTSENNNILSAPSVSPPVGQSMEDRILTSKIGPACQKYLTKTGDKGFQIRNELLNQAVNNTVENILKDTGKRKLGRPKLHPAPTRREIRKITLPFNFPEASQRKVHNTYSGPSAPKPSTDPLTQSSILPCPRRVGAALPSSPLVPAASPSLPQVSEATSASPLLLPKPVPININYVPKNETEKEILKILQNSDLFKEHVRNKDSGKGVSFILRKIVNKNSRLLGYSVYLANKDESESDGSVQKFVIRCDTSNNPNTIQKFVIRCENANIPNSLTAVNPENLPESKNNRESLGLRSETSPTEIPTTAMPRIRVRPVSYLQKVRTLNHELFPQTSNLQPERPDCNFTQLTMPDKVAQFHEDTGGFSHLPSSNQDPFYPKSPTVVEVTKLNLNPQTSHLPSRLSQYSDSTKSGVENVTMSHKKTPIVLNSMVARQEASSPHVEIQSNAPIIPGLVPVTKEHLKQMGIERICITNLPPSYTPTEILPVIEPISIKEEPLDDISERDPLEVNKEYASVQNDLHDDIDIKEEPLSYEADDVSTHGFESDQDQDSVLPNESTSSSSGTALNEKLLEDTDRNLISSDESTLSASETPLDDETLQGLLDIGEIEEYDRPEYIQIRKVDGAAHVEFGEGVKQQTECLACKNSENPALSDEISDDTDAGSKRRRRRKRLTLVRVDSGDEPPKKKRITKPAIRKTTPIMNRISPVHENVCTLFTKFTSQGDYINDHDYLSGPYKRYGMIQMNKQRCRCLLCDKALPVEDHVKHMQCHSTYCHICKLDFHNVFLLNLHVRGHIYRCHECNVNVTYARHSHHATTHNLSPHLTNIPLASESTITKSTTAAVRQYPIRRKNWTMTRPVEEDGELPISATGGNQLQSGETANVNPKSSGEAAIATMSALPKSSNNTNVNTISTASSSSNQVIKKKSSSRRKPKSRKRRYAKKTKKSQKNETVMVENKVEDKAGVCKVSESDIIPENIADQTAKRIASELDAAESNAKESNVLEIKENNLKLANEDKLTDRLSRSSLHALENFKEDDKTPITSQRRSLRSSNTPSPSRIISIKEEPTKNRRYPSRRSVVNTPLPLIQTESETSSKLGSDIIARKIVNNDQCRSELSKAEPENISNDHPQDKRINPFAILKQSKEDMEQSQKTLLENSPVKKKSEADNTEDSMEISESTLNETDITETTMDISEETSSSQSSGGLNLVGGVKMVEINRPAKPSKISKKTYKSKDTLSLKTLIKKNGAKFLNN